MAVAYRSIAATQGAGASLTCAKPSGVVAGDVLIAFHGSDVGALGDMGTPTGGAAWQLLTSVSTAAPVLTKVWWKIAGASEPSSYGFGQNSSADGVVDIVAVSGGATSTPVAATTTGSGTSIPTPGITPGGSDDLEIRWAAGQAGGTARTWTPPAGLTERSDHQSNTFITASAATRQLTSSADTTTANFVVSNTLSSALGVTVAIMTGAVDATISPVSVDAEASIPSPGLSAGQTIHAGSVDASAEVSAPGLSAGQTVPAGTVDAQALVPNPSVAAGSAQLVDAPTVTAAAEVSAPTLTAISNATPSPPSVDAQASVLDPAITAYRQALITTTSVDAQALVPTAGVSVPVLPGENITRDGQVEWGGIVWGWNSFTVREITGWVDQKPQLDDLSVEEAFRHGALAGTSYAKRRIVTIKLQINSISDPTQLSALLRQLRYDTRTLRDNTLWPLVIRGRTETLLAYGKVIDRTGVWDADWSNGVVEPVITIMCPDPRCYSLEQQSTVVGPMGTATLVNDGDVYTSPILRFPGPAVNPAVLNETLDRVLAFNITLGAGERLDVDTQRGKVLLGDVNRTSALADDVSVPVKEWFLDTGPSVITYETDSGGAAGVEIIHRSATM